MKLLPKGLSLFLISVNAFGKYFNLPTKIETGSVWGSLNSELQRYCCRPGAEKIKELVSLGFFFFFPLRVSMFILIVGKKYYSRYVLVFMLPLIASYSVLL